MVVFNSFYYTIEFLFSICWILFQFVCSDFVVTCYKHFFLNSWFSKSLRLFINTQNCEQIVLREKSQCRFRMARNEGVFEVSGQIWKRDRESPRTFWLKEKFRNIFRHFSCLHGYWHTEMDVIKERSCLK